MAKSCGKCHYFANLPSDYRFTGIQGQIAAEHPSGICKYPTPVWADDNRLVCSDGSARNMASYCVRYKRAKR